MLKHMISSPPNGAQMSMVSSNHPLGNSLGGTIASIGPSTHHSLDSHTSQLTADHRNERSYLEQQVDYLRGDRSTYIDHPSTSSAERYLNRTPPTRLLEFTNERHQHHRSPIDRSFFDRTPPSATDHFLDNSNRTLPPLGVGVVNDSTAIYGNTSTNFLVNGHVPGKSPDLRLPNGYLQVHQQHQQSQQQTHLQQPVNTSVHQPSPTRTTVTQHSFKPVSALISGSQEAGVREMLTSLGLLCLVSLLLALLALVFLLKITPVTAGEVRDFLQTDQLSLISPEEYVVVYEVTLALCAVTLSLNLCCLLVCAVQFLFAVKLVKAAESGQPTSTTHYLNKSNVTRILAVGGFFISIPVFLTGIILYTFIQFHSTPAIITSSLIGAGIIYCGCAMVHNVFVWQMEKTNAVRALARAGEAATNSGTTCTTAGTTPEDLVVVSSPLSLVGGKTVNSIFLSPPSSLPQATLDLSSPAHELSTLV